jgi:hypothetical protein
MRCSTGLLRESIYHALAPRLTAQLPVDQWYRRSIDFAGSSDRFAPVGLEALSFALAKLAQRTIAETLANEYATDPVVTAVLAGALRCVKRKDTIPKSTKRFDDWSLA